jgi:hypothetical protein
MVSLCKFLDINIKSNPISDQRQAIKEIEGLGIDCQEAPEQNNYIAGMEGR